jgi:hypothetical protein
MTRAVKAWLSLMLLRAWTLWVPLGVRYAIPARFRIRENSRFRPPRGAVGMSQACHIQTLTLSREPAVA